MPNHASYKTRIKSEYLPPPLEQSYLSIFDINVKLVKQSLRGTQEQKINTIKQRIIKFFDYGNQPKPKPTNKQNAQTQSQQEHYIPQTINSRDIRQSLEIDATKLIINSNKTITFQLAEKMFPGFISYQKVNESNIKIQFSSEELCKSLLWKNVMIKNAIVKDEVMHPLEIAWFQLLCQEKNGQDDDTDNQKCSNIYARYSTNKDDLLFKNDNYFRNLLGKVRQLVDQKTLKSNNQEQELKRKIQRNKVMKHLQKRKFITKPYYQKKNRFDISSDITFYEECFNNVVPNIQTSYSRNQRFNKSRNVQTSQNQRFDRRKQQYPPKRDELDKLNISEIHPVPIQLEQSSSHNHAKNYNRYNRFNQSNQGRFQYSSRQNSSIKKKYDSKNKNHFFQSRQSKDIRYSRNQQPKRILSARQALINQHRKKSTKPNHFAGKDYEKQENKRIERMIQKSGKQQIILEN